MIMPYDLARVQLERVVEAVQNALWLDPDTGKLTLDKEWSMDTLDTIASVMTLADLAPDEEPAK